MESIHDCSKTSYDVCAVKRAQEKKLDVVEMRTLRWMSVVTKLSRIKRTLFRETKK